MRAPKERLRDMLEAIAKIQRYTARGREASEQDELLQVWVLYHIQLIAEAAARLGKGFHDAHSHIPWAQVVAMRNILVHEYFGLDWDEVWRTAEQDLPRLSEQIEELLRQLEREPEG